MGYGRIVLDNSVDQDMLEAHAANPDAVLDVTGLDLRRLPASIRATLSIPGRICSMLPAMSVDVGVARPNSSLEQRWRWNDPESQWNYQARTGLATSGDQAATDARRVNPNWDSGCCQAPIEHNGFLNSSSIQANIERRFSNGLAFQCSIPTYIHAMTTNDTGGFDYGGSSINSNGSRGYAVPETILILGKPSLTDSQSGCSPLMF